MSSPAPVRSMTGAGRARGASSIGEIAVELRAVNGRGLAVKVRLPGELQADEREVERAVRGRLARGTVTVSVRVDRAAQGLSALVDEAEFASAAASLVALAERHGLASVTVRDVLAMPGVMNSSADGVSEGLFGEISPVLDGALDALIAERDREGAATAATMREEVDTLVTGRERIAARAPALQIDYRERLLQRVEEFIVARGSALEAADVVREVAVFADRAAIDEELQRLDTHLQRLSELLGQGGVVGRKLEFLLQEVLREVNTIGSKSPDVTIAHEVVAMKSAVDKLKEQSANIE